MVIKNPNGLRSSHQREALIRCFATWQDLRIHTRESSSVGNLGRSACNLHALDLMCPGPFNCWPGMHVKMRKFD